MEDKSTETQKTKKRKRKFGDRKEGRYLKKLDAYYRFMPYIMKSRNDACNYFMDSVEVTDADRFLRQKRTEGYPGMGMLHLFLAAYIRVVSQKPAINRFVSGQRIYARNDIEFVMSIKKSMESTGGETSIKIIFEPTDTIYDVYNKLQTKIDKVRNGDATSTDDVADMLMKIPRLLLKFALFVINMLDYFGKMPKVLLEASPFHGSFIITDIGSLGIPPIYHHIYNFGNLPVFLAFGAKRKAFELTQDGTVAKRKYVDYTVVSDERICDGFYFAQAFKHLKSYMKNPTVLETPPETVVIDE